MRGKRQTPVVVRCLSDAFGVEVLGVDARAELSRETGRHLRSLCVEHSVLLLRGQELALPEQAQFASIFGKVLGNASSGNFVQSVGELELHFDHWLFDGSPEPLDFTNLFAMDVAPAGAPTVFASVRRAHDLLPARLRLRVQGRRAVHVYDYSDRPTHNAPLRARIANLPPGQPAAIHPLVRPHPETGEPTLYASPRNTDHVVGLELEESELLLAELFACITVDDNLYVHVWEVGDLLIWDNHAVLHGRPPYDSQHRRRLRRMCIR